MICMAERNADELFDEIKQLVAAGASLAEAHRRVVESHPDYYDIRAAGLAARKERRECEFQAGRAAITHAVLVIAHTPPPPRDGHVYRDPSLSDYLVVAQYSGAGGYTAWGVHRDVLTHPAPVIGVPNRSIGWLAGEVEHFAAARGVKTALDF